VQFCSAVLADNKLALNAGWDEEILAIELDVNRRPKLTPDRRAILTPIGDGFERSSGIAGLWCGRAEQAASERAPK